MHDVCIYLRTTTQNKKRKRKADYSSVSIYISYYTAGEKKEDYSSNIMAVHLEVIVYINKDNNKERRIRLQQ